MTDQPNAARLVAELQALTLALHIGGLDGLRNGSVAFRSSAEKNPAQPDQPTPEGRAERR